MRFVAPVNARLLERRDLDFLLHALCRQSAAFRCVAAGKVFRTATRAFVRGNRLLRFAVADDLPIRSAAFAQVRHNLDDGFVCPAYGHITLRGHFVFALRTGHLRDFGGFGSGAVIPVPIIELLAQSRRSGDAIIACGFVLSEHRTGEREQRDASQCRHNGRCLHRDLSFCG